MQFAEGAGRRTLVQLLSAGLSVQPLSEKPQTQPCQQMRPYCLKGELAVLGLMAFSCFVVQGRMSGQLCSRMPAVQLICEYYLAADFIVLHL